MRFQEQEAYRQWLLQSLGQVDHFLAEDHDFRGSRNYERGTLAHQRRYVEDGKYRVVFLGAFRQVELLVARHGAARQVRPHHLLETVHA